MHPLLLLMMKFQKLLIADAKPEAASNAKSGEKDTFKVDGDFEVRTNENYADEEFEETL